jgi:hypothetical protein
MSALFLQASPVNTNKKTTMTTTRLLDVLQSRRLARIDPPASAIIMAAFWALNPSKYENFDSGLLQKQSQKATKIDRICDRQSATSWSPIFNPRPPLESWQRALHKQHEINEISTQLRSLRSLATLRPATESSLNSASIQMNVEQ